MNFKEYLKVKKNIKQIEDEIRADLQVIFCDALMVDECDLPVFFHDDSIIIEYRGEVSYRLLNALVDYFEQDVGISSNVPLHTRSIPTSRDNGLKITVM